MLLYDAKQIKGNWVKVTKFSLYLTKPHAMKTYPFLN